MGLTLDTTYDEYHYYFAYDYDWMFGFKFEIFYGSSKSYICCVMDY